MVRPALESREFEMREKFYVGGTIEIGCESHDGGGWSAAGNLREFHEGVWERRGKMFFRGAADVGECFARAVFVVEFETLSDAEPVIVGQESHFRDALLGSLIEQLLEAFDAGELAGDLGSLSALEVA